MSGRPRHRHGLLATLVTLGLAAGAAGCSGGSAADAGPPDAGAPIDPTYANIEPILMRACTFSGCHGGAGVGAGELSLSMAFDASMPATTVLDGVPACEYPMMPLVDPGHPENSWLMIKIDPSMADSHAVIQFTPDPSFDPSSRPADCQPVGSDFGALMPNVPGTTLEPREIEAFRQWIAMGASPT